MKILSSHTVQIKNENEIIMMRQLIRNLTIENKFSSLDQTKIVTAASELGRNAITYGKGGECRIEVLENEGKLGVRLTFSDKGPGIEDIDLALTDGYTSGHGMGLGLSGSKRLMNEFVIKSETGVGTTITVAKWK